MTARKRYLAGFKAKVALEVIREELTTAELVRKFDIHPTMISGWKRTAIENMASSFGGPTRCAPDLREGGREAARKDRPFRNTAFFHTCSRIWPLPGNIRFNDIIISWLSGSSSCAFSAGGGTSPGLGRLRYDIGASIQDAV